MGSKRLINRAERPFLVTLTVRDGDEPGRTAREEMVYLADGSAEDVTYDRHDNPYLDAIRAKAADDSELELGVQVVERGDAVDQDLNTNDTVLFGLDFETGEVRMEFFNIN
jgi:hypothetical protein